MAWWKDVLLIPYDFGMAVFLMLCGRILSTYKRIRALFRAFLVASLSLKRIIERKVDLIIQTAILYRSDPNWVIENYVGHLKSAFLWLISTRHFFNRKFSQMGKLVDGSLQTAFSYYAGFVSKHPYLVIIVSLALTFACGLGFVRFTTEGRAEKLFIPQHSQALTDQDVFNEYFDERVRVEIFIFAPRDDLQLNVLTASNLISFLDYYEAIRRVNVTVNGEAYGLDKGCLRRFPNSPCEAQSILEAWGYDRSRIQADRNIPQTILDFFSPEQLKSRLGEVTREPISNAIVAARAAKMTIFMESNPVVKNGESVDEQNEPWEDAIYKLPQRWGEYDAFPNPQNAIGNAFSKAINGDLSILFGGYLLLIGYVVIVFLKPNIVRTRIMITIAAILNVGFSIIISYGLASALGIKYGPVNNVLPFILLGIGVDDAFIIVDALEDVDRRFPHRSVLWRMKHAMGEAGVSIFLTSLTDMIAFLANGITTQLPAIQFFCYFAVIGIAADFLLQINFFAALVTLDARRVAAGRLEFLWCVRCTGPLVGIDESLVVRIDEESTDTDLSDEIEVSEEVDVPFEFGVDSMRHVVYQEAVLGKKMVKKWRRKVRDKRKEKTWREWFYWCCVPWYSEYPDYASHADVPPGHAFRTVQRPPPHFFARLIYYIYAPLLLSKVVKFFIWLLFLGLLSVSIYGISQLSVDFSLRNFVPTNDPLQDYFVQEDKYFPPGELVVSFVMEGIDYFKQQEWLLRLGNRIEALDQFEGDVTSWYKAYYNWLSSGASTALPGELTDRGFPVSAEVFYTRLGDFMSTAGNRFRRDIVYRDESRMSIKASRFRATTVPLVTADDKTKIMRDTRGVDDGMPFSVVPFAYLYLFFEQFVILTPEAVASVGTTLLGGSIALFLLLGNPLTACIVIICVVLTVLDVVGLSSLWGINIDSIAVVNVVLAIGLSVDYSVHVGHTFMLTRAHSRDKRVQLTLGTMGVSVLNGGISTFMAVVILAFSTSFVFKIFFKMFFLTILLGLGHGLILLPVLLATIGPDAHPHASEPYNPFGRPSNPLDEVEDVDRTPGRIKRARKAVKGVFMKYFWQPYFGENLLEDVAEDDLNIFRNAYVWLRPDLSSH